MKHFQLAALTAAFVLQIAPAVSAEYRMLASWDKNYPGVPGIAEPFIKNVEAVSRGSIKITLSGPETVPPFEQLQPVASGAFHFLYSHGSYHFGVTPVLAAVEAIGGDVASRRASGILDHIDAHYQKLGVKIVAFPSTPDGTYQIILRQPVSPSGDLQGRKLRGTPISSGLFRLLGASPPVGMAPGEIYTSLDKGVIEGTVWTVQGGVLALRWYEVAKYLLRPAYGFSIQPIFMNLNAWNRLSDAERKILLDEGRKIEDAWYREAGRLAEEEEKALIAKGMMLTQVGPALRAKVPSAFSEGLWEIAAQNPKTRKDVEDLRQFARQKGLSN